MDRAFPAWHARLVILDNWEWVANGGTGVIDYFAFLDDSRDIKPEPQTSERYL